MRKLILLFTVFFLTTVNAQDYKFGVTGNFHQGSIVGVHDRSVGKFGGNLGAYIQFPLLGNDIFDSAWLNMVLQVEYSMQGENAKVRTDLYGQQKFHHDYITATAYLKYFFKRYGYRSDIFLFAGPQIGYLVRESRSVHPNYDLTHAHINMDNNLNSLSYGVSLGAGYQIDDKWEVFMRFDREFSKVYPNNTARNNYNRFLGIGANYHLIYQNN